MRMAWGDEWTGSEWVRCTELRLWLGMLLLPPGLANHRFCMGHRKTESSGWVGKRPRPRSGGVGRVPSPLSWARLDTNIWRHTSQAPPPPNPRSARLFASSWLTCRPWPPRLGLVRACRGEMPPMPEGLRRPILPGGRARGGIGNCRWVRRATPIPTEPAMGSEFEPNAQL